MNRSNDTLPHGAEGTEGMDLGAEAQPAAPDLGKNAFEGYRSGSTVSSPIESLPQNVSAMEGYKKLQRNGVCL